jgi:hypothetical protein
MTDDLADHHSKRDHQTMRLTSLKAFHDSMQATPLPSRRHHLMALLAAPPPAANAAAEAITTAGEWSAALRLGERWKVLPALAARLEKAGQSLPAREAEELRRSTGTQFIRTSLCLRAGAEAMGHLQAAGIPAAAFKGSAVIACRRILTL